MLQVSAHSKIFLCIDPVDFRKGVDGLLCVCRQNLEKNPYSGSLFVFRNRRATAIKILTYDGQGWWLAMKRLSQGRFHWWPSDDNATKELSAGELQTLLWNGNPIMANIPENWRKLEGTYAA